MVDKQTPIWRRDEQALRFDKDRGLGYLPNYDSKEIVALTAFIFKPAVHDQVEIATVQAKF